MILVSSSIGLETVGMPLKGLLNLVYEITFLNNNNRDISETDIIKMKASIGCTKAIIAMQQAFDSGGESVLFAKGRTQRE